MWTINLVRSQSCDKNNDLPYYIWMLKLLEKGNFSNCSGWYTFILTLKTNLLHGNYLTGDFISSLVYNTIRP